MATHRFVPQDTVRAQDAGQRVPIFTMPAMPPPAGSPGPAELELVEVACGGLRFVQGSSRFSRLWQPDDPDGCWHLVRVSTGRLELLLGDGSVIDLQPSSAAAICRGGDLREACLGVGTMFECLSVTDELLTRSLSEWLGAPIPQPVCFSRREALAGSASAVIFSLGAALRPAGDRTVLRSYATAQTEIRDLMVRTLLRTLEHNHSAWLEGRMGSPVSPGHVKRAADFMRAQAARPITMEQIAAAARVSPRTLQAGFQSFHGCSPFEYLRKLRLEGARRDLLDPSIDAAISVIASRWGFRHPGVFAGRYREAFGEHPRDTRSRKDAGP